MTVSSQGGGQSVTYTSTVGLVVASPISKGINICVILMQEMSTKIFTHFYLEQDPVRSRTVRLIQGGRFAVACSRAIH